MTERKNVSRPLRDALGGAILASLLIATACSAHTLPTYDTVRNETEAAIQRIADEFPPGARAVPHPEQSPYGCGSGAVMYTGHWDIYPAPGFNAARFIDELPDKLGEGLVVEDLGVETSFPLVSFVADDYGGVGIDVSAGSIDGADFVDIVALSRCAQPPE